MLSRTSPCLVLVSTLLLSILLKNSYAEDGDQALSPRPNNNVTVEFSSDVYRVNESSRVVIVAVTIETDQAVNLTITSMEKSSQSRAKAMVDFAVVPYELTLLPGERIDLDLGFPVYDDGLAEQCEEEFSVVVMSDDEHVNFQGITCIVVVILDDDDPIVQFGEDIQVVYEEQKSFEVPVVLKNVEGVHVDVSVSFIPGDVTRDYPLPKEATSARLASSKSFVALPLKDNNVYDGPRFGALKMTYERVRSCLQHSQETNTQVVIREEDVVNFAFGTSSYTIPEGIGSVSITVVKTGSSAVPVDVMVTANEGTATEDEDFQPFNSVIPFLPGDMRKSFNISIVNDDIFEEDEEFTIRLHAILHNEEDEIYQDSMFQFQNEIGNTTILPDVIKEIVKIDTHVTVTVGNDDMLTIEFEQDSYQATVSEGLENVTIHRHGHTGLTVVVRVTAEYQGAEGFPDVVQHVKITGEKTAVGIFLGPDGVYNPDAKWKIRMELVNPLPGIELGNRSQTEIRILETDARPRVTFMSQVFQGRETLGLVMVKIEWIGKVAVQTKLKLTPFELTDVPHPARADDDFTSSPVEFVMSPDLGGKMVGSLPLRVINDNIYEMTESFGVRLESDSEAVDIGPWSQARIDLEDDDGLKVGFNETSISVERSVGSVDVCVKVRGRSEVPLNILLTTPTTIKVTAVAGKDFEDIHSNFTFPPNMKKPQTLHCKSIHIYHDEEKNVRKEFIVSLEEVKPEVRVDRTSAQQVVVEVNSSDDTVTSPPKTYRTCLVTSEDITPFHTTLGLREPYPLSGVQCEHVIFQASTGDGRVEVVGDLQPDTKFGFRQLGIQHNNRVVVIDENAQILNIDVLGKTLTSDSTGDLYAGDILVHQRIDGFDIIFQSLDLKVGTSQNMLSIQLSENSSLVGSGKGLCGTVDRDLLSPEGVISEEGDDEFVKSWKVLRHALPVRAVCRRNATVTGDPVFEVPLHQTDMALCFELLGRPSTIFNFISDTCLSVNVEYRGTSRFTFMEKVAILAQDSNNECHSLLIDIVECRVTVNGAEVDFFQKSGISVIKRMRRVRVSVPNCHHFPTVLWVMCKKEEKFEFLELTVVQGGSLTPTAHGILGQFWNVPIAMEPYSVKDTYLITVTYPDANERKFVGEWSSVNWVKENSGCVYAGNSQAGPAAEFEEFNDPVIMGNYKHYIVSSLFDPKFLYNQFNDICSDGEV